MKQCNDELEEIIYKKDIDQVDLNLFTISNPYLTEEMKEKYSEDSLIFGGYYYEKRIQFPAVIHIKENERFDITNVYIGTVNMDETLGNDEIVSKVLYIRPEISQQVMNIYQDGENSDEPLSDHIDQIYSEINDGEYLNIKELFDQCICETLEVEGKGVREEEYAVVKTLDDEILFDGLC